MRIVALSNLYWLYLYVGEPLSAINCRRQFTSSYRFHSVHLYDGNALSLCKFVKGHDIGRAQ
ncbi:hypothetical protein ZOSMA_68G00940 [Zostera marina]|uniref:Uncharacterized protein n=1 Tax=Zostera marina TaxID=29655 RepID=A0A0K9NRV5_ZOSMR|nr:hypothetical protein ZOSMA_68G00940 [Zostera marina]